MLKLKSRFDMDLKIYAPELSFKLYFTGGPMLGTTYICLVAVLCPLNKWAYHTDYFYWDYVNYLWCILFHPINEN